MPLNVAHQLPTKLNDPLAGEDIRRTKRLQTSSRRTKQQRDNIENAPAQSLSTASLANLPIQKQSTKVRKRLLTETQPNSFSSDSLLTKKHKVLHDAAVLQTSPLHRTLSEKSTYLNQGSIHSIGTGAHQRKNSPSKAQLTLASWRRDSRSKPSGSESDDADDEHEILSPSVDQSTDKIQPSSVLTRLVATSDASPTPSPTTGPRLGLIGIAFGTQSSPTKSLPLPSCDEDPFGSDTTLTSPEDSDDEHQSDDANSSISTLPLSNPFLVSPTSAYSASSSPNLVTTSVKLVGAGRQRRNTLQSPVESLAIRLEKNRDEVAAEMNRKPGLPSLSLLPFSPSLFKQTDSSWQERELTRATPLTPNSAPSEREPVSPRLRQSLMTRIINGKNQSLAAVEVPDITDSSDGEDWTILMPSKRPNNQQNAAGVQTSPNFPRSARSLATARRSSSASTVDDPVAVEVLDERTLASVMNLPSLAGAQTLDKSQDHLFVVPVVPVARTSTRPSALRRSTTTAIALTTRREIGKHGHGRPSLRSVPHPRLFQTCLDIMTQSDSTHLQRGLDSIKVMLKHSLERGIRKVQESSKEVGQPSTDLLRLDVSSIQLRAWGAVIGNGKGLLKPSIRDQEGEQRMAERRAMVADAYRSLELSPPPENWDKSSKVIAAGLSFGRDSISAVGDQANGQQWSNVMDDALDHLSRRHGCEYCRKTYKNKNGLLYHMERCPMAKLQTSIASDPDGDSTASETEDQRQARCPRGSRDKKNGVRNIVGENSNDEDEDEDEDEEGVIMCVCGSKEDEGSMVQCDKCEVWLHIDCLDLSEDDIPDEYFCPPCQGIPSTGTGGKSFRHSPSKASRRNAAQRKAGRPRQRSSSAESLTDYEDDGRYSPFHYGTQMRPSDGSEVGDADSMDTDEGNDSMVEGLVSPQVVLNHDWEQGSSVGRDHSDYSDNFLGSLYGRASARAIFRQSRAPELMLDGSSSQEAPVDMSSSLLPGNLGVEDGECGVVFEAVGGEGLSSIGIDLSSDPDMSFHRSQTFEYLPSTDSFFEQGYGGVDEPGSEHVLISEETVDSDGLRTPIDLYRGQDHTALWTRHGLESHIEDTPERYDLAGNDVAKALDHYPELLTGSVSHWFGDEDSHQNDEFDLNGLIDLEAVSMTEK
ncbi:hypothetical protein BGZ99_005765 [Dissophora globulifera]|uniref:PHD-type domain-containing protein n=1 Tax=Dissophora globulifera TaxID=979702 RepID=A0A9P6RTA8_9FUNG|nr:hypothetical protein BGZ99_005765 [Dissophora globulifera]